MEKPEGYITNDKTVDGAEEVIVSGKTIALETACTFKTLEAAKLVTKLIGAIKMDEFLPEMATVAQSGSEQVAQMFLVTKILPMAMEEAPDVILKLAGLMMAGNKELEDAYDEPNGVKGVVAKNVKWLMFHTPPESAVEIISAYFPYMGVENLKNSLGPLVKTLGGVLRGRGEEEEKEEGEEGETD
uniref:Uncharacterized protein n=1 Tax=viral metagenome TaxID=1070528 RepID=A0A6M3KF45_9ZZZZ